MNTMPRLFLTDLGIINALGYDQHSVLQSVLSGDNKGLQKESGWLVEGDCYVAAVKQTLPAIDAMPVEYHSRNNQLLLAAYRQIEAQVAQLIQRIGADRIAVVLGSSTSGIAEAENALQARAKSGRFPQSYRYVQQEMGSPALFLADLLGLGNAALTISTACSSSAKAFSTARNLIHSGFCDAALVGGVDTLCRLTLNGFNALECIAQERCKPFCEGRDGITIGEAAALFILSPEGEGIELLATGESSDAYHMSSPEPQGRGAEAAMRQALQMAKLAPQQITYINLHGTATLKNDEMEAAAVNRIFKQSVPCSSTKSLTGHTLGAAGATEVGLCWLLLSPLNRGRRLAPHHWGGALDPKLAKINYVSPQDQYDETQTQFMLSNSFAFGGNNVSVIISKGCINGG